MRKRKEHSDLCSMLLEAVCPPWLCSAGKHRWCEPKENSPWHMAPGASAPPHHPAPCSCRSLGMEGSPCREKATSPQRGQWDPILAPPAQRGSGAQPARSLLPASPNFASLQRQVIYSGRPSQGTKPVWEHPEPPDVISPLGLMIQ